MAISTVTALCVLAVIDQDLIVSLHSRDLLSGGINSVLWLLVIDHEVTGAFDQKIDLICGRDSSSSLHFLFLFDVDALLNETSLSMELEQLIPCEMVPAVQVFQLVAPISVIDDIGPSRAMAPEV